MNLTQVNNQGFSILPVDPEIFPPDVVALANKIDAIEITREELQGVANESAQEDRLRQAELADAQALKEKILAGEDTGLDATPNYDQAVKENRDAETRARAIVAALNESYRELRALTMEHGDTIISNAKEVYARAATDYSKTLDQITTSYAKAADAYGQAAGIPRMVSALLAHSATIPLVPEPIIAPTLDTSRAKALLKRTEALASAVFEGDNLPAHTGTFNGPNGLTQPVDVLHRMPAFDNEGRSALGRIVMDDGVELTRDRAVEIIGAWRELLAHF